MTRPLAHRLRAGLAALLASLGLALLVGAAVTGMARAETSAETSAETPAETPDAYFNAFQAARAKGDFAAAAKALRKGITLYDAKGWGDPQFRADLAATLATTYLQADDTAGALEAVREGLRHARSLTSRDAELYAVRGWAEQRLGAFFSAAISYQLASEAAAARDAEQPGQYPPALRASFDIQALYSGLRAGNGLNTDANIAPLRAAIARYEKISGKPAPSFRYLLALAYQTLGFAPQARAAYLDLAGTAPPALRAVALSRLAMLEWDLGDRDAAAKAARAALASPTLTPWRALVMRSLIDVARPGADFDQSATRMNAEMAALGKAAPPSYSDTVDLTDLVGLMLAMAPKAETPGDGKAIDALAATAVPVLQTLDTGFAQDKFAAHKVAGIRLQLARLLEARGPEGRKTASALYEKVRLNLAATPLETAFAYAGLGRVGGTREGKLDDSFWTRVGFSETAAGAAEDFLVSIPSRFDTLQGRQIARLSGVMEQSVDALYDQVVASPPLHLEPDRDPMADHSQRGPYSLLWQMPAGVDLPYPQTATEGHGARLFQAAFRQMQLARQSSAGRAVAEMAARLGAGDGALAQLLRKRDALIEARNRTVRMADKATPEDLARRAELERALARIDAELDREYPAYRDRIALRPLALTEARDLLRPGEALVLYLQTDAGLHVFVVSPEKVIWYRTAMKRAWLGDTVRGLRHALDPRGPLRAPLRGAMSLGALTGEAPAPAAPEGFDLAQAHALYQAALGPVVAGLPHDRTLYVVPDGALQFLPFAVMVAEPPDPALTGLARLARAHWAIRDNAFATLPVAASLRALRKNAPRQATAGAADGFIGIGDPLFRQDPSWLRLPQLPETAQELRALDGIVADGAGRLMLGAAATEADVEGADLRRASVIAFATHGLMGGEAPGLTEPALALTPAQAGVDKVGGTRDGLLTASEITGLDLDASWVVLSACNTASGGGPASGAGGEGGSGGEGLSGLARAFFYAGARQMIVSHWAVRSDATVALTTGMFKALEGGAGQNGAGQGRRNGPMALRRSMLDMIDHPAAPDWVHPGVWAPFVVVGG